LTAILGISAFYHDSAAALVIDGKLVAAAQEERFSRIKHDPSFPRHAIRFCLQHAGITVDDLDHVAFYEKPFLKFERLLETYLHHAPLGLGSFFAAMPVWLKSKLYLPRAIRKGLSKDEAFGVGVDCGGVFDKRIVYPRHHQSHAASAFYPSPFEQAAILTVDGVGEWSTATLAHGSGHQITTTDELRFPDSLGLLYSAFTYFCGFHPNGGEGKLMGLAPYGDPVYADQIMDKLVDVKADGSLRMNQSYFNYCAGRTMTSAKFERWLGPRRVPESEITQREKDIAASIQSVTEAILLKMVNHLHQKTGMKNLCIAGGVALNCVANGRLRRESPFEKVWVQPAAGDSGGAIGAALLVWHQLLENEKSPKHSFTASLGPDVLNDQAAELLTQTDAQHQQFDDTELLHTTVAKLLSHQKTVGWAQGRMEFGPRALGNRSILADPRDPEMQDKLNRTVKFREPFRPFAPVVLHEHHHQVFESKPEHDSPWMLFASQVRSAHPSAKDYQLPAITHVDGSARVQTVAADENPKLYALLQAFQEQTGCPVLLNTSFNVRGQPIVCSVVDAIQCFASSGLDALVIGDILLIKDEQSESTLTRLAKLDQPKSKRNPISLLGRIKATLMAISLPIRFLVSHVILTLIYFLLITPIGMAARFQQKSFRPIDPNSTTYWQPREDGDTKTDYLKQY
jgi:carbamoyltransferase